MLEYFRFQCLQQSMEYELKFSITLQSGAGNFPIRFILKPNLPCCAIMPLGSRESTSNLFKLILAARTSDFFKWEFPRCVFFLSVVCVFWVAANNLVMLIKQIQMKSALWDKLQESKKNESLTKLKQF